MLKLVLTEDGSHTLYSEKLNETYHSLHGAWQESVHVYLKNGLEYLVSESNLDSIKIFELGFGTGMNAILSLDFAEKHNKKIDMTSIEPYPVSMDLIKQMNYEKFIDPKIRYFWQNIHEVSWENK
ncbi:MAG: methyltransferase, partial [Bacteroidetes bacterium]